MQFYRNIISKNPTKEPPLLPDSAELTSLETNLLEKRKNCIDIEIEMRNNTKRLRS